MKKLICFLVVFLLTTSASLAGEIYFVDLEQVTSSKSKTCAFSKRKLPPVEVVGHSARITALVKTSVCFSPDDRLVAGITTRRAALQSWEDEKIEVSYRYSIGLNRAECVNRIREFNTSKLGGVKMPANKNVKSSLPATIGGGELFFNDDKVLCFQVL